MAMTLSELVKEVETAAAKAELVNISGCVGGYDRIAGFHVTAHLDEDGKLCSAQGTNPAATVVFDVMKLVEEVRR